MNERVAAYRDRLTGYWQQFSSKQKMMIAAVFGVLILSIVIFTYMFSRTSYEIAFQNLDATDAAGIAQYLDGQNIKYQLVDGGSSIAVPTAVASRVKVDVGSQGLVQNGSLGFDEFTKKSSAFGITDKEFEVKFRNALNGEVQKLLLGMEGVSRVKALVTLPEESVFAPQPGEEEAAQAAITMTFKPGFRPTQEAIDGYYNLVKTAVPNLTVENITITSPQGELFPSSKVGGANQIAGGADMQFQVQRKYENDLKRNIQSFLGQIVGAENLVISVASSMNFDQKRSTEERVLPLENNNGMGAVVSRETDTQTSTNTSGQAGGVSGTGETDVPGYQATDPNGSANSERTSERINYDLGRSKLETVSAPFVLKDLTVNVGVEQGALTDESQASVMAYLTQLVRTQLADSGQDLTDDAAVAKKVTIISQAFADGGESGSSGVSLSWVIGIGAVALVLAGLAAFLIVRRRKQAALLLAEDELVQPAKVELPTIDLDSETTESQVRKQLEQLAKRKPEDFVNLLRTWLVDE